MSKKALPWLITLCALGLGATAGYYSIIGLSKLFAGVATAVIIMASFLELSKLTLATLLHSYWKDLKILFKIYYTIALIILSIITSVGIYGMLSSGYQETANKAGNIDAQISLLETKRDNYNEQLKSYSNEKESINKAVTELRNGLSNNKIQYRDADGNLITTTSGATRRALEKQLDQAIERQTNINVKVDELNQKVFEIETEIVEVKTGNDLAGELGPLKYVSDLTGKPMDEIINYLLLIIIFVFDPLAIALVVAANFSFEQLHSKTKENIPNETIKVEKEEVEDKHKVVDKHDDLKDEVVNNLIDNLEDEDKPQKTSESKITNADIPSPIPFGKLLSTNKKSTPLKKRFDLDKVKDVIGGKKYEIYNEAPQDNDWKIVSEKDEDDDLIIRY